MKQKTILLLVSAILLTGLVLWAGSRIARAIRTAENEALQMRFERDSLAERAYRAERAYALLILEKNQRHIDHINTQLHELEKKATADSLVVRLPDPRSLWPGRQ